MESISELKLPPRLVPALGKASNTDICFSIENTNRLHAQDSHHFELHSPMRTLKGKQSGQEQQNLRPKFVISKVSSDSHTEVGSSSFSGVSHPREPVDIDLMRPVHVPIGQDKVDAKGLVRSLSKNGVFLDDISIQFPVLGLKPSLSAFSPAESFAKKQNVLGAVSIAPSSENVENDLPHDSEETECVWDNSLPSSSDTSPNSNIYSGDVLMEMSTVNSCKYQNDEIFINGMLSIDRDYEITKGSNIGDSLESAETSLSRASYSSGLSDDSNWSSIVSSANKPHKGNDPRWNAILGILTRERSLGMSHFRLLKRLGCGDIGTVYLSELSGTPCYFALKVMDKASLASRNKLTRAQTEREILQLLDHPFLPTLYSYFETDQFSCLVMEYCPGGDLHSLRQRQPGKHFPEYAARFYAAEVLLAIEYLHMLGVVYRDLKPENVLVRDDGHIMLSDFDLSLRCMVSPTLIKNSSFGCDSSKRGTECIEPTSACVQPSCFFPQIFLKKNSKNTKKTQDSRMSAQKLPELVVEPTAARSMSFVGTHEYLAPEIIKGEGHGSAVDWWTFGIFLHELLFGKTPFKGSGNRATMFNVVGQQLKLPVSPATSSASRDLIRSLLVKEPQDRLGVKRGAAEIKQHPFFDRVNWALIRCSTPPTVPRPVEAERPAKFQPPEPVGVCSSAMVGMDMNSGGKFLDFEFF